jgi:hypothetical protein
VSFSLLIADTYYPAFIETFHGQHPELDRAGYEETLEALLATRFGTSDFYSKNLRLLGHEVHDVVANERVLQEKWIAENCGVLTATPFAIRSAVRKIPRVRRLVRSDRTFAMLALRIRAERPDVLYLQNLALCEPHFIASVRPFVKLIVGQIACLAPPEPFLRGCDLILSSFPGYVERFRSMGIDSEYLKIAFEPSVLERLPRRESPYEVSFVGGFERVHAAGTALLEKVAREIDFDVWGHNGESIAAGSALRRHFHGEAWGTDMYGILFNSKITLNRHGVVSPENEAFANNMRLYEATGAGAMLLTDEKDNLGELFEVGTEVVAYRDARDLIEKIRYYLGHDEERVAIARAGQERTLRDHTYSQRMKELEQIIAAHL